METDPPTPQAEQASAIGLFGTLLRYSHNADTGEIIPQSELEGFLWRSIFRTCAGTFTFSKGGVPFYAIATGPSYASRYAPCFSMVLTRMADIDAVKAGPRQAIRAEANGVTADHTTRLERIIYRPQHTLVRTKAVLPFEDYL